jgi:PAS domain S-box-containing protein
MLPLDRPEKPSVLIVDDEPQVATALADVLEDLCSVLMETTPKAALKLLEANKTISVVLSDQRMPGMTGDELFSRARGISTATRILMTGYADISAVINAVNQGKIFAYITKPWEPDDVIRTVSMAAEYYRLNRKILGERALLQQIMESSIDAIAIKDRHHRYVRLNKYEARILGLENPAEAEGRTLADFLPLERSRRRQREEAELLRTGIPVRDRVEEVAIDPHRPRWYSANMAPIRGLSGDIIGIVGITHDVTEAKRLDQMKDAFIAAVRHELRSPLTAVHAALGLLRGGAIGTLCEKAARLIEIAHDNCGRLLGLVGDLLDTVNLEKREMLFEREPVDIADLLKNAVESARPRAQKKEIAIDADPIAPTIEVEADRGRLLQVLDKLVSNAIEVAPSGSGVRLAAAVLDSDTVRVSVLDQGPGVPRDVAARIFQRFSQGDLSNAREKGGVGLGLYIAKAIVEAHDGRIGFANRKDGGAEFYFDLPIRQSAESPAAVPAAS